MIGYCPILVIKLSSSNTHPLLTLRPYCWMKSVASAVSGNINIRTTSSTGNAVGLGPTVWAMFKVFKALALT